MFIGITGSFGAGKGSVAEYLVREKGFHHFSARSYLVEELKKRGLPIDRDAMAVLANELRAAGGSSYIFEQLVSQAKVCGGDAVIESIRAVAEARYVKEQGGVVLGVDADPEVRYERIVERGSETDHVTFEEWHAQEVRESNPDDPTKQDIFGALKESDHIIMNTSTVADLEAAVDQFLTSIHG